MSMETLVKKETTTQMSTTDQCVSRMSVCVVGYQLDQLDSKRNKVLIYVISWLSLEILS